MAINSARKAANLRPNCLSFPDIMAQSVALIAPTATAALNAPLAFASAGNGTWFAYVMATIGLVLVGLNINHFARRSASPGALYTYVAKGLGPTAGVICGWSLTLAYLFVAGTVVAGFSHYLSIVLAEFNLQVPSILLYAVCAGAAWYYAYTDIQLSAVLMLIIELVAVGSIIFLAFLVLSKQGFRPDMEQLTLVGVTPSGISLGMVIAILSYVGFESSTTLGYEAKSPGQAIPRALIWSTVLVGLFFILISYTEVLTFRSNETPLNESSVPLNTLASFAGTELLGVGLNVGIAFSYFSCCLASINAGARVMFALSRQSFYPSALGEAHARNRTPHIAVSLSALIVFLVPCSMLVSGLEDIETYSYLGTISTYGFLVAYILVSIAAPVYLAQRGELRRRHLAVSFLAGFFMLIPVAGSFFPVPAFPFNIFPYLFLLYLGVGAWLFLTFRQRSQVAKNLERDFKSTNQPLEG